MQHQRDLLLRGIYNNAALGHRTGDDIGAARCDGHHAVYDLRTGAGYGRRFAGKGNGCGVGHIGRLHISRKLRCGDGGFSAGHGSRCIPIGGTAAGGGAVFAAGGQAACHQCGAYYNR